MTHSAGGPWRGDQKPSQLFRTKIAPRSRIPPKSLLGRWRPRHVRPRREGRREKSGARAYPVPKTDTFNRQTDNRHSEPATPNRAGRGQPNYRRELPNATSPVIYNVTRNSADYAASRSKRDAYRASSARRLVLGGSFYSRRDIAETAVELHGKGPVDDRFVPRPRLPTSPSSRPVFHRPAPAACRAPFCQHELRLSPNCLCCQCLLSSTPLHHLIVTVD